MTDGCHPVRVPRTQPPPDWGEYPSASGAGRPQGCADRHAHEVRYWAAHLEEFVSFLPGIRRRRGDERAGRLVADVLTELRGTEGPDAAVIARDRLMDRWRGEKPGRWS